MLGGPPEDSTGERQEDCAVLLVKSKQIRKRSLLAFHRLSLTQSPRSKAIAVTDDAYYHN